MLFVINYCLKSDKVCGVGVLMEAKFNLLVENY